MSCQSGVHAGRGTYIGGGIHHFFRHLCFQMQHMHRHKHPPPPSPLPALSLFVFRSAGVGWGGGGEHRVSAVLTSSPSPLHSSSKSLSGWSHRRLPVFPLTLGRVQRRIKKENKGRWLSNYKQLTRLMHCVVQSKGQYPESCIFPAVRVMPKESLLNSLWRTRQRAV